MSEREQKILEKVAVAIPQMSEYDRGYLVGLADGYASKEDKEMDDAVPAES